MRWVTIFLRYIDEYDINKFFAVSNSGYIDNLSVYTLGKYAKTPDIENFISVVYMVGYMFRNNICSNFNGYWDLKIII